ncbi:MAG TPA: 16S rRNA (guanine(527)-N(7))-methyltransferase RsmG [Phycisphaerales bacterium]|nr:16S rRNA (guanine(527)-N(7))-methyltransferase RsmG [Phycisphaerales bacterium]HCD32284.1 16S rRNA (guanine(527)-N(7))-methyltransferase RsmG [Phycisphaerales bacterium]|tara:strand:+ start:519 stop:1244 length:726 start_codon:yes stop_codon:yes gene_type:complete
MTHDIPTFVPEHLQAIGVTVTDEQLQQLAAYLHLMLETNKQFNLTAIREPQEAWKRHIIDSLTLVPGLIEWPAGSSLVDVGTGGGLPGIPLAIVLPQLKVTLLETTGKKARFCQTAADALGLSNIIVINNRAETLGQNKLYREKFDMAVSRAVGPMRILMEYMLPLVKVGGWMYALKGPALEQELEDAGDALATLGAGEIVAVEAYPESFENHSIVVGIEKADRTPKEYPRLPGIPKQQPL